MSSHLEQDANMNGVYVRSDGSSILSFDGSDRSSMVDSKKGNVTSHLFTVYLFKRLFI